MDKELENFINPQNTSDINLDELKKDLIQLMTKYNLVIDGCKCCDSPYLSKLDKASMNFEQSANHLISNIQ